MMKKVFIQTCLAVKNLSSTDDLNINYDKKQKKNSASYRNKRVATSIIKGFGYTYNKCLLDCEAFFSINHAVS